MIATFQVIVLGWLGECLVFNAPTLVELCETYLIIEYSINGIFQDGLGTLGRPRIVSNILA